MTGSAEDAVRRWLRGSGVPLEFRTAEEFRRIAWQVEHARMYRDVTTEELREADVLADVAPESFGSMGRPQVAVRFVVECKSSKAAPWVAFAQRQDRLNVQDSREQVRDTLEVVYRGGFEPKDFPRLHDAPVLASTRRVAYQLTDTGSNSREAYGALRQVMSAVMGLRGDVPQQDEQPSAVVFVPVLVTSAPLFVVRADGANEPTVTAAERVLVVSRVLPVDRRHAVWVVHEDALADFVDDARASVNVLGRGY